MKNSLLRTKIFLALIFITFAGAYAQEMSVGADIVNRYIWRGTDFGRSPSIQPTVEFDTGGLALGFWGALCNWRVCY